ncbi:MAG TPA: hypothetical protein VGG28_20640 [Kofleriaceae bacterium]|jgi:hypothetical protein
MTSIDPSNLSTVAGGSSRTAQCERAADADFPTARADWGNVSAAYFFAVHPYSWECAAGKRPVGDYYGAGARARAAAAGVPTYPR